MRYILLLLFFIILPVCAVAQGPIGDTIDCTDIRIDYIDDPNLTKEERLILMEKALMDSINKFDYCQKQRAMKSATDTSNNDGSSSSIQGTDGDGNMEQGDAGETENEGGTFSGGMESAASSSMSGTEPAPSETELSEVVSEDSQPQTSVEAQEMSGSEMKEKPKDRVKSNSGVSMSNGQTPEDIPDAKNDDALAAQIRYAAENETDPEKRKQLWNEYRKYKGLPKK
ncbi:MAG: hypothetical protein MI892_09495 [Desulfobacterales bacterium]|nr:hypothetical protein [Desulfobacterales bacterium]